MPLSKALRKALASLLLLAVFAVLMQGVLHECFHEREHHAPVTDSPLTIISSEHGEGCHSHHQSCSSLSCAFGALFLAGSEFCWQTFNQVESFQFPRDDFNPSIIAVNFFKPPRTIAS